MSPEKWQDIKGMVKDKFSILEEKTQPLELKIGLAKTQKIGEIESIVFISPLGKIKLEYSTKPVILDKIEHYSKRMGASSNTEYILSDSEFVHRFEAYIWKNDLDDWQKFDFDDFGK